MPHYRYYEDIRKELKILLFQRKAQGGRADDEVSDNLLYR